MKNMIRFGLATGLAAAIAAFGVAGAQTSTGQPGSGTGSGSPDSVGKGDTGRSGSSTSSGGSTSSDRSSGSSATGSTGSSGATAGSASTGAGQKVDKKLQERLEKIHAGNQAELQLAQLGAQNAQSPDVKQLAQAMQTEHQQMDQKLTQTAQSMGVSLEGKDFQKRQADAKKDAEKLQSKTGKDFDKEFMSRIVKDHESSVKEVKDAASDAQKGKHQELASLLQQTQTQIQGHLDHAKQVQKSLDQSGQQRQGRRPTESGSSTGSSGAMGGSTGSSGSSDKPASGSRGDTGGPAPGPADRGSPGSNPSGGAAGTSSDPGTRQPGTTK